MNEKMISYIDTRRSTRGGIQRLGGVVRIASGATETSFYGRETVHWRVP